ncbi:MULTISPECIES: DUF945 domain-containing protein [Paenibacillus]|uniref:DUF945 domain-containing protein n=1 Tax=Paenibacillus TaxID=44249 RepID=UPI0011A854B0|nr:DUF945 domain-containing protein [Paenibacillus sp. IHBB 10380]
MTTQRDMIEEFMKEFENHKPVRSIIKKSKEQVEQERTRQAQEALQNNVPFGYFKNKDGDEIKVDPHQAEYLRLTAELYVLGLHSREIKAVFREMSVPKVATDGYDLSEHRSSIIERGKQLLQERLAKEEQAED